MHNHNLRDFITRLKGMDELKRIHAEIDPYLEMTKMTFPQLKAEKKFITKLTAI